MPDNKTKTGHSDRTKINHHEPHEMETAEHEMHAPDAQIPTAIAKVGTSRAKVAEAAVSERKVTDRK